MELQGLREGVYGEKYMDRSAKMEESVAKWVGGYGIHLLDLVRAVFCMQGGGPITPYSSRGFRE